MSGARNESNSVTQSAASRINSAGGSAGITAMKPLIEPTTGLITGIARGVAANASQAEMSSASVLPGASDSGAFSVA